MKQFVIKSLGAAAWVAIFVFTTAGLPTNGLPTNGLPTNGLPTNGLPTNGLPTNGLPTNGLPTNGTKLDDLESSLLFANPAVHQAFISHPFTKASLTDTTSPLYQVWSDGFSRVLLSYLWQDAHAVGDDLVWGNVHFYGNLGLCDSGGPTPHGWARDTALDDTCARWVSAVIITQINQSGIHNLFSVRGPSGNPLLPGYIGRQLTDMSPEMVSYDFQFGTAKPVTAVHVGCVAGTTGAADCGWQPGFVGTGASGTVVRVSLASTVPVLAQANQGIMAHSSCPAPCTDPDVLAPAALGTSVQFTVPPSGVFNVQWTTWARADLTPTTTATMTAQVIGLGTVRFPADELDIFPASNREMTAWGNIFGQANIDPALWSCPANLVGNVDSGMSVQLCVPGKESLSCQPCTRPWAPGAQHVIFPNAHLWLSRSWNNAQAYYHARSCSSDLSTCIATFEGFIDAFSVTLTSFVPPCLVQNADTDSHVPLPYAGLPRTLHDANYCFVGLVPHPFHEVTTFFPNYRDFGACAAIGTAAAASCSYTPQKIPTCDE
jgi:hypothetical protein